MRIASRRLLAVAMVLACARIASAQTADDVIEKHLAAIAKLTSRSLAGTMTLSTPAGDVSGTIEIMNQQPNKVRTLTKLDLSSQGGGPVVIDQRFDGTSG